MYIFPILPPHPDSMCDRISEASCGFGIKMFDLLNRRDERMGGDLTTNCLLQVLYHIKYLKVTWFNRWIKLFLTCLVGTVLYHIKYLKVTWFTRWIKIFLTCMDISRSKPASQLVLEFLKGLHRFFPLK